MSSREGDSETAQYLEDERMAILLQNEEFVRELQHNQEFMSTLQMDAERLVCSIFGHFSISFYAGRAEHITNLRLGIQMSSSKQC